jgi:hypothetical protein
MGINIVLGIALIIIGGPSQNFETIPTYVVVIVICVVVNTFVLAGCSLRGGKIEQ